MTLHRACASAWIWGQRSDEFLKTRLLFHFLHVMSLWSKATILSKKKTSNVRYRQSLSRNHLPSAAAAVPLHLLRIACIQGLTHLLL